MYRFIILILFGSLACGCTKKAIRKVCFQDTCVKAEIADSDEKRVIGLMFRKQLPEDQGMLFLFDKEDKYSFWMKNVELPLDIIWIAQDKKVADIHTDVPPCRGSSCETFGPREKVKYVLEVNAGFVKKNKIAIGEKVCFND